VLERVLIDATGERLGTSLLIRDLLEGDLPAEHAAKPSRRYRALTAALQ
jgi:hypothetical protein